MPEKICIVPLREEEIEEIIKIQSETGISVWTVADYTQELNRNDTILTVAKSKDNEVVGFVFARLIMNNTNIHKLLESKQMSYASSEIYNIAVKKNRQKHGIGQLLLDSIVLQLKSHRTEEIWLEVRQLNLSAINFYKRNGFINKYTRKEYYKSPVEDALIMRLDLTISRQN